MTLKAFEQRVSDLQQQPFEFRPDVGGIDRGERFFTYVDHDQSDVRIQNSKTRQVYSLRLDLVDSVSPGHVQLRQRVRVNNGRMEEM